MRAYRVNVRRGRAAWLMHLPDIDQTAEVRSLREVDQTARDLITANSPAANGSEAGARGGCPLDVVVEVPAAAAEHWRRAAFLRSRSAALQSEAATEAGAAARSLRDLGLTVRDIGAVLDVSYQRADQLLRQGVPDLGAPVTGAAAAASHGGGWSTSTAGPPHPIPAATHEDEDGRDHGE